MTKDEALDLALEALEQYTNVVTSANDPNSWETVVDGGKPARDAITAIKQARLAQVQEPVACVQDLDEVKRKHLVYEKGMDWKDPLYPTPPAAQPAPVQEPLFWYRPCRDGMYEGPVHNNSVGGKMLRDEKPDEWKPLYTTPPAAPVQEPVAIPHEWRKVLRKLAFMARTSGGTVGHDSGLSAACEEAEALLSKPYTTPPAAKRQWVGLTDGELNDITCGMVKGWVVDQLVRAIEAKFKEKNNG